MLVCIHIYIKNGNSLGKYMKGNNKKQMQPRKDNLTCSKDGPPTTQKTLKKTE